VWVDDWVLQDARDGSRSVAQGGAQDGAGGDAPGHEHWTLHAAQNGYELTLDARALQAPVLNGDRGFSRKSDTPGVASYYYSIPRVAVRGQLIRDGKAIEVHGLAWVDREWGSGPLDEGWDWFALQFRDGSSLMFYSRRDRDGRRDPHSAGTWISATGESRPLSRDDVQVDVLDYWKNPRGERYPVRWHVRVPSAGVDAEVRPVLADQELTGPPRYWEGAVDVVPAAAGDGQEGGDRSADQKSAGQNGDDRKTDGATVARGKRNESSGGRKIDGQPSAGRGYVELVGYAAQ
jgi:predicted secreted hydrolase